jgi:hypothetical protein
LLEKLHIESYSRRRLLVCQIFLLVDAAYVPQTQDCCHQGNLAAGSEASSWAYPEGLMLPANQVMAELYELLPLSAHAFFVLFALAVEDRHGQLCATRMLGPPCKTYFSRALQIQH